MIDYVKKIPSEICNIVISIVFEGVYPITEDL